MILVRVKMRTLAAGRMFGAQRRRGRPALDGLL
jgi:hypothetical protein